MENFLLKLQQNLIPQVILNQTLSFYSTQNFYSVNSSIILDSYKEKRKRAIKLLE